MRTKGPLFALAAALVAFSLACGGGGGRTGGKEAEPGGGGRAARSPGVTDTEVKIGTHTSLTGPIAFYNVVSKASKAYFDKVNEEGGVNGRKIVYQIEDDAYSPPKAVEVTKKLVEQDQVFAVFNGLGTPTHSAVVEYLKQSGVPDFFPATGADKWGNPVQKTVFAFQPSYVVEGKIFGRWIADNFAGKKVGFIFQNDDFGRDGVKGVKESAQGKVQFVGEETFEPGAPNLNSQVLNLKNAGADVVYLQVTTANAASAIKFAKQQGWSPQFVMSYVNFDQQAISLGGADTMEGVVSGAYLKLPEDTSDPGVQKHHEILKKYAPGVQPAGFTVSGQAVAELMVEVLKKAGKDLTRESIIKAAESIRDFRCSVCTAPVNMSEKDHAGVEGLRLGKVQGGKWVVFGEFIDFETTK